MRILFIALDVDLARGAGDAVHLRELVSNLDSLGHEVICLVGATDTRSDGNMRARTIVASGTMEAIAKGLGVAWNSRPDVIYERRLSPKVGFAISRLARVPLMVEVNGLPDEEKAILTGVPSAPSRARIAFRRFLLRRAKGVIAVSNAVRASLIDTYDLDGARLSVVPNGVNLNLFRPLEHAVCRTQLGLSQDERFLGFVGHLVPWQGVDQMIRVVAYLEEHGRQAKALVVGDGPDRRRLELLTKALGVREAVTFVGRVPYESVPVYIGALDVAFSLKPPLIPGSPLKVREYMACGRPILASRGTEYDFHVIEEAGAGLLVDSTDVAEASVATLELLEDPSRREQMGLRARSYAEKNCSWRMVAEEVSRLCSG